MTIEQTTSTDEGHEKQLKDLVKAGKWSLSEDGEMLV